MAHGPSARHRVYLLTVWREEGDGRSGSAGLRFSLKDPRTGERRGFATVEALVAHLEQMLTGPGTRGLGDGESSEPDRSSDRDREARGR